VHHGGGGEHGGEHHPKHGCITPCIKMTFFMVAMVTILSLAGTSKYWWPKPAKYPSQHWTYQARRAWIVSL
jgi:hypothetical protein